MFCKYGKLTDGINIYPLPHRREINQLMFQRTMDVVNIDSIRYFTKFKTYVFTMVPQKPM